MLSEKLAKKYGGLTERVGFVLADGTIIECENIAEDPTQNFQVAGEEILKWADEAVATWHTHTDADANLSTDDYDTFLGWSSLDHYIIGNDGVRKYIVREGDILID